jgi:3-phytase
MRRITLPLPIAALVLAACGADVQTEAIDGPEEAATARESLSVAPSAATAPVAHGSLVNAAFLHDARDGSSLVVGAAGIAGLEVYRADGTRLAGIDDIEAGLVTTAPGARIGDETADLVVVYDATTAALAAYVFVAGRFEKMMPEPIRVADEVTGLCHYRSPFAGSDYLYAVTDAGLIHHYELYSVPQGIAGRLLRTIPSAKGSGFCAVDPRDGALYVAEETNGVWRIGAEAEEDTTREAVDLVAPFGTLSDDVKGIAVYPVDDELSYLFVSDLGNERIAVYRLPDGEPVASFSVEGLSEPEGIALSGAGDGALFAIADEDPADGGSDIKLVDFTALANSLGLEGAGAATDPDAPKVVQPVVETDVIPTWGDSADDPAIWVHPDDPGQSIVIGTGKKSGLYVFDLEGRTLQVLEDGRMNNVDLRDGFPLGGKSVTIVAASNRSNDGISLYRLDPATRKLVDVSAGVQSTGFTDPYGLCLYKSASDDAFYAFVNEGGDGKVRQLKLADNGKGRVAAELVREFAVGSQAEGCVADDQQGTLYIAEEDLGLWKYSAEADGGDARTAIDSTGDDGRLTDDVEGVALYDAGDGKGYLVVSNQGENNYAVYRREGDNEFVGFFSIVANAVDGIDGASETDGLDVSSAALGSRFPGGLLVVQDGRNIAPEERQNFKYVSWTEIASVLGID